MDIVGDADGVINITFPDGLLVFNGDAGVDFHYGNAEANARLLTIDDALQSYDPKIIQAAELARRARVMEYDPHYCDVIIERWERQTGKQARQVQ